MTKTLDEKLQDLVSIKKNGENYFDRAQGLLSTAVLEGNVRSVKIITLEFGGMILQKNHLNQTLLHRATLNFTSQHSKDMSDIVKFYVEQGGDVNDIDNSGNSILCCALAKSCGANFIGGLIDNGAKYISAKTGRVDNILECGVPAHVESYKSYLAARHKFPQQNNLQALSPM